MRTSVAAKLRTVFGLSLFILVVIGGIAFYDTQHLVAVTTSRSQARQFWSTSSSSWPTCAARRTNSVGYLLTGEPAYRAAYQKSTATFGPAIADLKRRDPSLKGRLDALEPLIAAVIQS